MRTDWVASPPPGVHASRPARPPALPYYGPPSYPAPPRWGFPLLVWRWPTAVAGTTGSGQNPVDRVGTAARTAAHVLSMTAALYLFAAAGEGWRYALLMRSRDGLLSATTVAWSDSLVVTSGVVGMFAAVLAWVFTVVWLRWARRVAADVAGFRPARPDWKVLVGLLVPGLNLVTPGTVLAELEHAALRRPAETRPTPGRLVLAWWSAWAGGALLFVATVLWSLRGGVQAMADGVLLHGVTDVVAAAVAVLTVVVIRHITALVVPVETWRVRWSRVVRVEDAPPPPLRVARPTGAAR